MKGNAFVFLKGNKKLVSKSPPKPGRNLAASGATTCGDSGAPWWVLVAPGVSPLVVAPLGCLRLLVAAGTHWWPMLDP